MTNIARQKKIIVIGAGLAGLAACKKLIEYGFDTVILEARNRIGGRVWTDNTMGLPFGRGAGWIHGAEDNPITKLANEFHAKMVPVNPTQFIIFDHDGLPIPHKDIQNFNAQFEILLEQAKELAYQAKEDISLATALSDLIKTKKLSPLENDLLKQKILFFEGYIGANYESLSARHWDQEEAWPGENCFLTSSYQPIIDGLAKDCPVELNAIVKEINRRTTGIEIVTANSVYYADAALITVPLGVLKKNTIHFNFPLPDSKKKAIRNLEMGVFNITAIKFPTAFWPKEPHAMFFTQFDSLSIPVFFNLHHFIQEPIIVGFCGGKRSRQLEKLSDEELIKKTMHNFKQTFNIELPEPESYINTNWSTDPFSYGSYSHIPVGASGADYEALAKPISNCLFFAGEATCSKYPATTHGAYLTGLREAERIKNVLLQS